jgi:hypothetical protein
MNATGFTLCYDLMELVGKSVVKRRKELKRIEREHSNTVAYWIMRSSDELVVNWVRNHHYKQRTAGERMMDRTDLINITLPDRHRLLDEIEGTDKALDRLDRLWYIARNGKNDCEYHADPYRNL